MENTKQKLNIELIFVVSSIILIVTAFILQSTILSSDDLIILILFAVSFVLGGFFKAYEGVVETIENKALNVEILMILAAISAFIVGNAAEGALLIMIFGLSGLLESYAHSKSTKELTSLLNLSPDLATKYEDGVETVVSVNDLTIGDTVIVKVGDSIPVDGIISRGNSSINEAAITGESMPVSKKINDKVYAGTFNLSSPILVEIKSNPNEFVVNKIIDLVTDAQDNQGVKQTKIEKIEKWYVYIVILLALGFMFIPPLFGILPFEESFYRGTVVLVVGSPCALMASIAPSMLSTISNAARKRILIKGGSHLETLAGVKAVIFDKTGTITKGEPSVVEVNIDSKYPKQDILDVIYSMEKLSTHPLAYAITSYLSDKATYTGSKVIEVPGHGMELKLGKDIYRVGRFEHIDAHFLSPQMLKSKSLGQSIVEIILNDQLIGYIALKDELRPDIQKSIQSLKDLGITPILLTGDNQETATIIAKEAGIEQVIAGALPHEKKNYVDQMKVKYGSVMMIGDGINDAPALASADCGAAMGSGTDLSLETADVIFMNNNLGNVSTLIKLAKANQTIIYQNMIFSISVIVILLLTNVFGLIKLPFGVIAHEGSTILVILNSLRMLLKK